MSIELPTIHWFVNEAISAADVTIQDASAGAFDDAGDLALSVGLDQVLSKLCHAWNDRFMGREERLARTTEEYWKAGSRVPNFGASFKLMQQDDFLLGQMREGHEVSKETVIHFISEARSCSAQAEAISTEEDLARLLSKAMSHLCLAWHLQRTPLSSFSTLDAAVLRMLAHAIPNWDLIGYDLVDAYEKA